jgi:hypothetical protein
MATIFCGVRGDSRKGKLEEFGRMLSPVLKLTWDDFDRTGCFGQAAPERFSTAGIVRARISKSSRSDHSCTY